MGSAWGFMKVATSSWTSHMGASVILSSSYCTNESGSLRSFGADCVSGEGPDQPFTRVAFPRSLAERRGWLSGEALGPYPLMSRAESDFRRLRCLNGPFL